MTRAAHTKPTPATEAEEAEVARLREKFPFTRELDCTLGVQPEPHPAPASDPAEQLSLNAKADKKR